MRDELLLGIGVARPEGRQLAPALVVGVVVPEIRAVDVPVGVGVLVVADPGCRRNGP